MTTMVVPDDVVGAFARAPQHAVAARDLAGVPYDGPRFGSGQTCAITIQSIEALRNTFIASPLRTAGRVSRTVA